MERVDGLESGEKTNVESEAVGDMVVERNGTVVGSAEQKDLEDMVFEEAIESHEVVDESVLEGGVEAMGNSSASVVVGAEKSKLGNEVERFEEAIGSHKEGVPFELEDSIEFDGGSTVSVDDDEKLKLGNEVECFHEANSNPVPVLLEEKAEDSVSGESIDKIDEGGTPDMKLQSVELNGVKDHEIVGGGGIEIIEGAGKDVPLREINSTREILHEDRGLKEELGDSAKELSKNLKENITVSEDDKDMELEGDMAGLDTANMIHRVEHCGDVSASVKAEKTDSSDGEVKETLIVDHEDNGIKEKLKNEIGTGDAKLIAGDNNSELKQVDMIKTVENNNGVAEESRQRDDKQDQEKMQSSESQVNKPREIQSNLNLASSGKSAAPPSTARARPAGLGRTAPLLDTPPRAAQHQRVNSALSQVQQSQSLEDSSNGESEEFEETREKLQMIRVKFLRLAHRLGQTPHNVVVAQVLYRLGLAEQLHGKNGIRVGAFSFDRASAMAEQLETAGQEPLDFTCTIMVLGKTGVGKSATINSIFDKVMFGTDAFESGTRKVQDVVGLVQGIKVRSGVLINKD